MAFQGTLINKTNGNLGRTNANKDRVIAFVAGGVATAEIALNEPKRLVSLADAEALLINESYDANNNVLVYDHLKELYRLAPNAEVVLMLVAQGTTFTGLFAQDANIETLIKSQVAKDVKYIFTAFNPAGGFAADFTNNNGICDQVYDCIVPAQQLINRQFAENRYIDGIMLDAIIMDDFSNLADLRELNAPNISVNITVDGYAEANFDAQVATGAAMGMYAVRQINENLGSVEILNPPAQFKGQENYPLDDGIRFAKAYLADNSDVDTLNLNQLNDIAAKGYIYVGSFAGYSGFYFSGDPTCVELASDYAYINNNCIWNKAARLVREALIPKIRSVLKKDSQTGYLRPTTVSALEEKGQDKLNRELIAPGFVSDAKLGINPEQTPSDQTPLIAECQVVKDGILHKIEINLGLFNQLTN